MTLWVWESVGWGFHSLALPSVNAATLVVLVSNKIFYNPIHYKTQIHIVVILTHLFRTMFVVGVHQFVNSCCYFQ